MSSTLQLFKVPKDQQANTGIYVAGGWHAFIDHPEHGRVVALPPAGDYSSLQGLGYVAVSTTPAPTPATSEGASEVFAGPAPDAP